MFEELIGEVTVLFNCKLGTTLKIKNKFNKPFMQVVQGLDTMDVPDLIKMLYCAVGEDAMKMNEFEALILDNLGLMELYDLVQKLVKKIQYPSLNFEEIDAKLEKANPKK